MLPNRTTTLRLAIWVVAVTGLLLFVAYGLQVVGFIENALVFALIPFGFVLFGVWALGYVFLRRSGSI